MSATEQGIRPNAELSALLAALSYKKGTFRLASGRESDFYVDVKQTVMRTDGARLIGRLLAERCAGHSITSVGGMAVGAVPLVAATLVAAAERGDTLDGFFVRRDVKDHGTAQKIDGRFDPVAKIALVEDVVTTGGSTLAAVDAVEAAGGTVSLIVTIVDREENEGMAALRSRVAHVESLATRTSVMGAAG